MRIVDVNEFYSPTGGGVRTYLDRKMGIMADLGHELIVIAPGFEDGVEDRPGGGRIFWVKAPRLPFDRSYGLYWQDAPIVRLLDQLDPDVVETSSPWRPAWTVGAWQGRALKIFFAHNDNMAAYAGRWLEGVADLPTVERWLAFYTRYMGRFLRHFDAFVTNGPALAKRHERRGLHVDAAMPLGIDRGFFSPDLRDESLRVALLGQCGLPADGKLLLGVGRHHPEKRWPTVIDAVECAGERMPIGLMLLGYGVDHQKLAARVAESPHIRLFRPVYDRLRFARIMASADALIHGSDAEPFGLVALEAVASGLPLIVPNEGGAAEIAEPPFAETYAPRDARSCAAAIARLFAREPRVLRAASLAAADKVRTDQDHAVALIDYYSGLIAGKAARRAAGGA
ncbi:alpha-1,6-mannosyltransferase [Sphingomonas guangdongensis]|uniref:Alpha-1,6-mannosyltransferase n=1 Tax=Sphingomonas guangdongensis TaxID=1141890 RepID=A0A285QCE4_9SPHN|nr:glycosyltransferase [Sphingomonas guangdongensis]SOB79625.1 alpha-1,6-mannosyltransferase [Sphingomonas guangdongensis]